MIDSLSLEDFLKNNRITSNRWDQANISWETLKAIGKKHEKELSNLENVAEYIAKIIQKFDDVHSVRWRVKDAEHLLEKIVRKRADGTAKYADITIDNYFEKVTDLIGVRALHLFKNDCFVIGKSINDKFNLVEKPVAFIRKGDSSELIEKFEENKFEVKEHLEGYRSIHFVAELKPQKLTVICEIQIRTIFEEGWSEIDHKVRYPNFSENALIGGYLEIFNRLAGSADDMGSYVLFLAEAVSQFDNKILEAKTGHDNSFVEELQGLFFGGNFPNVTSNIEKKTVSVIQNVAENPTGLTNAGTLKITVLRDTPIATGTGKLNPVMNGVPTVNVRLQKSPSSFEEGMMVFSANTGTTYDFNINMRAISYKEPLPAGEYEFAYEATFRE